MDDNVFSLIFMQKEKKGKIVIAERIYILCSPRRMHVYNELNKSVQYQTSCLSGGWMCLNGIRHFGSKNVYCICMYIRTLHMNMSYMI